MRKIGDLDSNRPAGFDQLRSRGRSARSKPDTVPGFTLEDGELVVESVLLLQGSDRRVAARVQAEILRARFPLSGTPLFALKAVNDTIAALEEMCA